MSIRSGFSFSSAFAQHHGVNAVGELGPCKSLRLSHQEGCQFNWIRLGLKVSVYAGVGGFLPP